MLGTAALAMWWDVTPGMLGEFEHWHSHEHFVERLAIAGFLRASRWKSAGGGGGIFVMYELARHDVLSSPDYLARLNAPSPWSTKMMPHHLGMVRSQCRVLASHGSPVAGHAATLRVSPSGSDDGPWSHALLGELGRLATTPGIAGVHLLRHERPAIAPTTEQKIRGGDREADWVVVVNGYDAEAVAGLVRDEVQTRALAATGTAAPPQTNHYVLAHSATSRDVV